MVDRVRSVFGRWSLVVRESCLPTTNDKKPTTLYENFLTEKKTMKLAYFALILMATAFLAPQSSVAAEAPPNVDVKIDNFSFSPATVTVPAGTQITWTNRDDIPHTVVSDDKTT